MVNAIKKGEKKDYHTRIEQGRATGFARDKDDEARELLRIFQVCTCKRVSFFILVVSNKAIAMDLRCILNFPERAYNRDIQGQNGSILHMFIYCIVESLSEENLSYYSHICIKLTQL